MDLALTPTFSLSAGDKDLGLCSGKIGLPSPAPGIVAQAAVAALLMSRDSIRLVSSSGILQRRQVFTNLNELCQ